MVESVNGSRRSVAQYCSSTQALWLDGDAALEVNNAPKKLEVTDIPGMKAPLSDLNFFLGFFSDGIVPKPHVFPSCGFVIQGSQGTGKSMILERIAATRWGNIIRVEETDKPPAIFDYFQNAIDSRKPTIILIDDIQKLLGKDKPNRQGATIAIREGLNDLAVLMAQEKKRPNIVVVATCRNYASDIPEDLRTRRGFVERVTLPIPDVAMRREILKHFEPNFAPEHFEQYISDLGDRTHAYTGKDLELLVDSACKTSLHRTGDRSGEQPIDWSDVQHALHEVGPTAMHDINLKPPTVRWNDIGGYQEVKHTMQKVLRQPSKVRVIVSTPIFFPKYQIADLPVT
jgi:AAA family ATPase